MDRNLIDLVDSPIAKESLSARRAWIEMHGGAIGIKYLQLVALRKESVDRNSGISALKQIP